MSDLFAGVYGARFPEVVMNSGPLPPEGGLPAPLHDTPDARINYGSTLLGNLQPYAYGEAGYMSSQSQNNQPHRIQKIIPALHLPEPNGIQTFTLSHAVDDSDLAFVMRLNRNSIFCTGTRGGTRRNTKIGTTVDPIINLPTLNYLLAGLQVARPEAVDSTNLWWEFLYNLDPMQWPKDRDFRTDIIEFQIDERTTFDQWPDHLKDTFQDLGSERFDDFEHEPFTLDDILHLVKHCVKPFGVVRGSEKQGGQHEMGNAPVSWTAPTIATLVIDGKEGNVVNIWHYHDLHAGDDLVLRLKLMPVKNFTLNHYFKGFARKTFEVEDGCLAWQLVPDVFDMTLAPESVFHGGFDVSERGLRDLIDKRLNTAQAERGWEAKVAQIAKGKKYLSLEHVEGYTELERRQKCLSMLKEPRYRKQKSGLNSTTDVRVFRRRLFYKSRLGSQFSPISWQELGYWHIGRTQVQRPKHGTCEFYNDDMANQLKTNHIEMTFQPCFSALPRIQPLSGMMDVDARAVAYTQVGKKAAGGDTGWAPQLRLERGFGRAREAPDSDDEPPARRVRRGFGDAWWLQPAFCSTSAPLANQAVRTAPAPDEPGLAAQEAPEPPGLAAPVAAPASEPEPEPQLDAAMSEESRQELLGGLSGPKKGGRGGARARKTGEAGAAASRGPVDGTLLRPGAEPEACRMELL